MRHRSRSGAAALSSIHFEQATSGIFLVIPLVLILVGLLLYPMVSSVLVSFQAKVIGTPGRYVGLGNYAELLTRDRVFLEVFVNTLVYAAASVVLKLAIGFVAALVLNERLRGQNVFRGWILMPWIIPTLVVGLMFRWMFDQTGGVVNFIILKLHLMKVPPAWLAENLLAKGSVVFANVWRGFPFFMITILAGLQSISPELHEAAAMDGARWTQRVRHVTIPGVRSVILVVVMLSIIWTYNDFELLWVMTGGGPSYSTHIFVTYAYQLSFLGSRFGYASAVSLVTTPLVIIFILLLLPRLMRDDE
jgi:multiple sugar transport system permease protein